MLTKVKIEWCDYSVNPVKGLCPMACPYCYARRMYKRFKWDETVRYDPDWYYDLNSIKKPSKIFVGSTMELFGVWNIWLGCILDMVKRFPHTFIFLTKKPENLTKWSPFPDNCWIGVSATNDPMFTYAWSGLTDIEAKVKFVSLEPLLDWHMNQADTEFTLRNAGINWLIIGQQTPASAKTAPKIEWIQEIVTVADRAGIPVFLKDNLRQLFESKSILFPEWVLKKGSSTLFRQEFPKERENE